MAHDEVSFYDPKMHGMDWDAMRAKYRPLVEFVGDRQELLNIINEMIGELNASHTGAAPPPRGPGGGGVAPRISASSSKPDNAAGRYRVTHVYEDGPADKDWVRVKVGDYLLAIDGKPVKAGDEYWDTAQQRLNRKVVVTFNTNPAEDGAWNTRIEAISRRRLQPVALRALGEGAPQESGRAFRRTHRLPAHSGDESTIAAQV